jgi:hypothetical protein
MLHFQIIKNTDLQEHDPPVEAGNGALLFIELFHELRQPQLSRQQLNSNRDNRDGRTGDREIPQCT